MADIKKNILSTLSESPDGLTISDLAKKLKMHRHTITKYVYELIGSRKIVFRQVGPAKLCYINKPGKKNGRW